MLRTRLMPLLHGLAAKNFLVALHTVLFFLVPLLSAVQSFSLDPHESHVTSASSLPTAKWANTEIMWSQP
jgi:hypothetical protein